MPIYEFHCGACGREFEELFRSSAEKRTVRCPDCGSRRVEKQWSTFGFSVRGECSSHGGGCSGGCSSCSGGSCAKCSH